MNDVWQTIETAPVGEAILVGFPGDDERPAEVALCFDNGEPDYCWQIVDGNGAARSRAAFTHWKPEPLPPPKVSPPHPMNDEIQECSRGDALLPRDEMPRM